MNITKHLIECIYVTSTAFTCIAIGIYSALKHKREQCKAAIFIACIAILLSFICGYEYYVEQQNMYCPNCHYEYKTNEELNYCPECNTKLRNWCDSCNKYLPDSATETCPYCVKEIEFKVGDIPNDSN